MIASLKESLDTIAYFGGLMTGLSCLIIFAVGAWILLTGGSDHDDR